MSYALPSEAMRSGYSGTHSHSHSGHAYTTMGHSSYSSSGHAYHPGITSAGSTHSSTSGIYHPGITHSATLASQSRADPHSYTSIHHHAVEKKKADAKKKAAAPAEIKSSNTLISPLKPKKPKTLSPSGPFISK